MECEQHTGDTEQQGLPGLGGAPAPVLGARGGVAGQSGSSGPVRSPGVGRRGVLSSGVSASAFPVSQ